MNFSSFLKRTSDNKNCNKGMTLAELLVVMGVIMVILSIGFGAFYQYRKIQEIEQFSRNLLTVIRNEQRESLLTQRQYGENWVYGVVLDLSTVISTSGGSTDVSLYSFCASNVGGTNYIPYPSRLEDKLPIQIKSSGGCDASVPTLKLRQQISAPADMSEAFAKLKTAASIADVTYVVFETVNGKIHYYDVNGNPIQAGSGSTLNIVFKNGGPSGRLLKINNDKGRITLESVSNDFSI